MVCVGGLTFADDAGNLIIVLDIAYILLHKHRARRTLKILLRTRIITLTILLLLHRELLVRH